MTLAVTGTILCHQAAQRTWDVTIIGAGPAGALLAQRLASRQVATLLIDRARFPRPKVCGGCVSAAARELLRQSGLGSYIEQMPQEPLREVQFCQADRHATLRLPGGIAVTRSTLDAQLVRAAIAQGAQFLPETFATVTPANDSARRDVTITNAGAKHHVPSRVVIVAGGLSGTASRETLDLRVRIQAGSRIGVGGTLKADGRNCDLFPAGHLRMVIGRRGYVGGVRVEGGLVNLAGAVNAAFLKESGGALACVSAIVSTVGELRELDLTGVAWHLTGPLTRTCSHPAAHRLLAVGDAAGYEEPFTGEGMTWGLETALLAVPIVERGLQVWSTDLERQWGRVLRAHRRQRGLACRALKRLVRSPLAVRVSLAALNTFPGVGQSIVQLITTPHSLPIAAAMDAR